jgi:hypothetical protein
MKDNNKFRTAQKLFLTSADVFVSLFLIFGGGYIATSRSVAFGWTCVASGFALIYLSVGLWIERAWEQIARLCFYGLGAFVLLSTVGYYLIAKEQSLAKQAPVPVIAICATAVFVVSIEHLRRIRQPEN